MIPFVIRRGDHLDGLAHSLGFDAESVWRHPENSALRELRPDPLMLAPGDILRIPEPAKQSLPVKRGTVNRYVANVPRVDVHLVLHDHLGTPLADEPYVVEGLRDAREQKTGPEGEVTLSVPVTTREVALLLVQRNVRVLVGVGDLDPIEEGSGVVGRLVNLGFLESVTGASDEQVHAALCSFQRWAELQVTGAIDEATRTALRDRHGC